MKIAIGSDHAGFDLKNHIRDILSENNHDVIDMGTDSSNSCDYPDFAHLVADAITSGSAERGILICGTGVGMSVSANKIHGIRAAAVSEPVSSRLSREHNDANIICMGARVVGPEVAEEIVKVFMSTDFSGGERHCRRIEKIKLLEN
jgi:ribose 5-phosphate isomerase B